MRVDFYISSTETNGATPKSFFTKSFYEWSAPPKIGTWIALLSKQGKGRLQPGVIRNVAQTRDNDFVVHLATDTPTNDLRENLLLEGYEEVSKLPD